MKDVTKNHFFITGLFLCFLLITFVIDNVVSVLLHPLLVAARKMFEYSFISLIMLKVFSLLAVFLASFGFGFLSFFTCKRAGLWASLYIFFSWLAMLYALYCRHMEIDKIFVYHSLIYIATIAAAYCMGVGDVHCQKN